MRRLQQTSEAVPTKIRISHRILTSMIIIVCMSFQKCFGCCWQRSVSRLLFDVNVYPGHTSQISRQYCFGKSYGIWLFGSA